MTHYAYGFKIVAAVGSLAAAVFFALDPTVKVAIVAGVALVASNLPALIVALMNHKATKEMSINVDGNLRRLLEAKEAQGVLLTASDKSLAHAEGKAQERDEERTRQDAK
jgi:hypothetical protein